MCTINRVGYRIYVRRRLSFGCVIAFVLVMISSDGLILKFVIDNIYFVPFLTRIVNTHVTTSSIYLRCSNLLFLVIRL